MGCLAQDTRVTGPPPTHRRDLTIYIAHSAATGNVGDDAMLLNAMIRLRKHFPDCRLRVPLRRGRPLLAGLPEHDVVPDVLELFDHVLRATAPLRLWHRWPDPARRGGGPAVEWRRRASDLLALAVDRTNGRVALRGLRALLSSHVLYITGDNALNDFNPAGVIARSWLTRIARLHGLLIVLSAQGIGPIEQRWALNVLRDIFATANLVSYRDHSFGAALGARLAPRGLWQAVVGDEAFSLPAARPSEAASVLHRAGVAPGGSYIAVHFREADFTPQPKDLRRHIAVVLDGIALRYPEPLLFFPMSYLTRYGVDAEYGRAIQSMMAEPHRLRIVEGTTHPCLIKACVSQARLTVGSSYHMNVFGLSQGVPAVVAYSGEYYAAKSHGLVDFYGAPNVAIDMKASTPTSVIAAAEAALEQEHLTRKRIAEINRRIAELNEAHLSELARRLDTGARQGNSIRPPRR